jgi:hypothetical protein
MPSETQWSRKWLTAAVAALTVALLGTSSLVLGQEEGRLQAARQKGRVVWYTVVFPTELREALEKRFQERTGLRISTYSGGGGQIAGRLQTERQTGAHNVDVIDLGDMQVMNGLVKEGILRAFRPPVQTFGAASARPTPKIISSDF